MKKLKTSEEYLKETFGWNHETSDLTHYVSYWKGLIKQAQLDAIQIAVERCAEEAKFSITENALIEDGELYDYYDDGVYTYSISNNSILNVANKLKEELK